jgi:hypothetical protein
MSTGHHTGREGRTGMAWAVHILARLQSERVGAFVPNPDGKVQQPCRHAVRCALDALAVESLDAALQRPPLARQITSIVQAHG